jgi:pimeloyl-ACP methyl ester carboxylesterase
LISTAKLFHPTWSDDDLSAWADAKLQVSQAFMDSLGQRSEPDWQELVRRLECPTLLLTADPERGGIVTPEVADQARQLNPRLVEIVHVSGAGHNIRRERYDAFINSVSGFLGRELSRI